MDKKKTLASIVGASAAAIIITFTSSNEGTSNTPYRDSGGTWTVCTGQTGVKMRYYTDAECDDMLAAHLAVIAAQIEAVTPGFSTRTDGQKSAIVDLVYNIGISAYTRRGDGKPSTIRQLYMSGSFPQACTAFLAYKYVGSTDCSKRTSNCYGVWLRRQAEQEMCLGNVH